MKAAATVIEIQIGLETYRSEAGPPGGFTVEEASADAGDDSLLAPDLPRLRANDMPRLRSPSAIRMIQSIIGWPGTKFKWAG
jgi:hypothetical protein